MSVTMDFSDALRQLKAGGRLRRECWPSGVWVAATGTDTKRVPAESFWSEHNRAYAERCGGSAAVLPALSIKTSEGFIQMGWVPQQPDLFGLDWVAV